MPAGLPGHLVSEGPSRCGSPFPPACAQAGRFLLNLMWTRPPLLLCVLRQVFPEAVALSRSAADYLERTGGQAVDIDNIAQRITVDVIGKPADSQLANKLLDLTYRWTNCWISHIGGPAVRPHVPVDQLLDVACRWTPQINGPLELCMASARGWPIPWVYLVYAVHPVLTSPY
eukprot:1137247-Pelagomonas_calceolata.AAC.1